MKFIPGQIVYRGIFDDHAIVLNVGIGYLLFADYRIVRVQYCREAR